MIVGWLIILTPGIIGLLALRQLLHAKTFSKKIIGGVFFIIFVAISVFLLALFDALSAANDSGRLLLCSKNLEQISKALSQYRQDYSRFPPDLETALPKHIRLKCYAKRSGPGVPYSYQRPTLPADQDKPVCWCSKPHHISHKYLKFRSCDYINVLYFDGEVRQLKSAKFPPPMRQEERN